MRTQHLRTREYPALNLCDGAPWNFPRIEGETLGDRVRCPACAALIDWRDEKHQACQPLCSDTPFTPMQLFAMSGDASWLDES